MAGELQAIGLDPENLPPLDRLEPAQLRKVMKSFSKSLGLACHDCHVENDFALPTPRKLIAQKMWDRWVRPLSLVTADTAHGAKLLYCDSCHQGRALILDRRDKHALSDWMDRNFVDKVKRADGKEHNCSTCHGEPFAPKFLARWAAK